jgi:hypothetical protein
LIEWKRTNCKMITRNKISAQAGIQMSYVRKWIPVSTGMTNPWDT